jgi:hypothetical protein
LTRKNENPTPESGKARSIAEPTTIAVNHGNRLNDSTTAMSMAISTILLMDDQS